MGGIGQLYAYGDTRDTHLSLNLQNDRIQAAHLALVNRLMASGVVAYPDPTDADIRAAALSVSQKGGGVVQCQAAPLVGGISSPIVLAAPLPLYSGVVYKGIKPQVAPIVGVDTATGTNNLYDEINFVGGTVFSDGGAGFYIFDQNGVDQPIVGPNLGLGQINSAGVLGIAADGCKGFIRAGALNQIGLGASLLDDVWCRNWSDWAYYIVNFGEMVWGYIAAIMSVANVNPTGLAYFGEKGSNYDVGIPGDGVIHHIFCFAQRNGATLPRTSRGVVFEGTGSKGLAGNLNGFTVHKVSSNAYNTGNYTTTATMVNGSPTISLPVGQGAKLRVGMPVMFTTTGLGFNGQDAAGATANNGLFANLGDGNGHNVYFIRWPGLKVGDALPGDQILLAASRNSVAYGEKAGTFTYTDATHIVYTLKKGNPPAVNDWFIVGNDANGELVQVTAVTGAGPYTLTVTAMTKTHPAPGQDVGSGLFAMSVYKAAASGTLTLETKGFPHIEVAAGDPLSGVSNVTFKNVNADGDGILPYYFENAVQSEFRIMHEQPLNPNSMEIVARACQFSEIKSNQPLGTDIDANSDSSTLTGARHSARNRILKGMIVDDSGAALLHRIYDFPCNPSPFFTAPDAGMNTVAITGDGKSGYITFTTTGTPTANGTKLFTFHWEAPAGLSKIPLLTLVLDDTPSPGTAVDVGKVFSAAPTLTASFCGIYLKGTALAANATYKLYYKFDSGV